MTPGHLKIHQNQGIHDSLDLILEAIVSTPATLARRPAGIASVQLKAIVSTSHTVGKGGSGITTVEPLLSQRFPPAAFHASI